MKIKSLVNIASWNLLKEDDNKIYEEEILQIKAKYGEEVTEDQIEGTTFPFSIDFDNKLEFLAEFLYFRFWKSRFLAEIRLFYSFF